jgi:hypothetical protein
MAIALALAALLIVALVLIMLVDAGMPAPLWLGRTRAAERRAADTVKELLSLGEYAQLVHQGYLEVTSRVQADRVYRVPALPGPVKVFEQGKLVAHLCLQPAEPLPRNEVVLVQKVLLEADEDFYWRSANIWTASTRRATPLAPTEQCPNR